MRRAAVNLGLDRSQSTNFLASRQISIPSLVQVGLRGNWPIVLGLFQRVSTRALLAAQGEG